MRHSVARLPAISSTFDELLSRIASLRKTEPSPLESEVSAWFLELREPLLRYLHSLGLPVEEGEDVAQEVFLALFRHLRDGKPRENLRGWIFRVGRNLGLKRRLALGRHPAVCGPGMAEPAIADPAPDPEALAEFNGERERLLAIFHALPERDRSCLTLRAEGLRYREIAEALDMSLGAVAVSLGRSIARLTVEPPRKVGE